MKLFIVLFGCRGSAKSVVELLKRRGHLLDNNRYLFIYVGNGPICPDNSGVHKWGPILEFEEYASILREYIGIDAKMMEAYVDISVDLLWTLYYVQYEYMKSFNLEEVIVICIGLPDPYISAVTIYSTTSISVSRLYIYKDESKEFEEIPIRQLRYLHKSHKKLYNKMLNIQRGNDNESRLTKELVKSGLARKLPGRGRNCELTRMGQIVLDILRLSLGERLEYVREYHAS